MRPTVCYLAICFAVTAATLGLTAVTNYMVDVNGVYHGNAVHSRIARYVEVLRSSRHGVVQLPLEREVKLELARQSRADCYVTGSSHEMQVSRDLLADARSHCQRLINLAVSGGTFEDLVEDLGILAGRGDLRRLYIGVGPWMLRRGADDRALLQTDALSKGRRKLGLPIQETSSTLGDRIANLFNGRYLLRNIEGLYAGLPRLEARVVQADAALGEDDAVTLPDGSHLYSRSFLRGTPPPEGGVGNGNYNIMAPYVDPHLVGELQTILKTLNGQAVQVVFLFSPYHPKVFACAARSACDSLAAVEGAIRVLAMRTGNQVIGGYDSRRFGLTWRDFYDDMHPMPHAYSQLR